MRGGARRAPECGYATVSPRDLHTATPAPRGPGGRPAPGFPQRAHKCVIIARRRTAEGLTQGENERGWSGESSTVCYWQTRVCYPVPVGRRNGPPPGSCPLNGPPKNRPTPCPPGLANSVSSLKLRYLCVGRGRSQGAKAFKRTAGLIPTPLPFRRNPQHTPAAWLRFCN